MSKRIKTKFLIEDYIWSLDYMYSEARDRCLSTIKEEFGIVPTFVPKSESICRGEVVAAGMCAEYAFIDKSSTSAKLYLDFSDVDLVLKIIHGNGEVCIDDGANKDFLEILLTDPFIEEKPKNNIQGLLNRCHANMQWRDIWVGNGITIF